MTVEPVGLVIALSASSLVWILATRWLTVIVLSLLESDVARKGAVLTVGRLPGRPETQHLAQLRGGDRRVAELLLAQAVADGWLMESAKEKGTFDVFEPREDASPDAARLKRHLGHRPNRAKLHEAALHAAVELRSAREQALEQAGMRRPSAHHAVAVAAGLFSAAAFTFAFAEFWEMAAKNPLAEKFVLGSAVLFALAMVGILATLPRKTTLAEAYESWFMDATPGVQESAAEGSLSTTRDVSLAVAAVGLDGLRGKRFESLRGSSEA